MRLQEATWPAIEETSARLAVVPVGSTEQHGPHAPVGTDTIIAEAIAEAACDRIDAAVLQTPPLAVGISEEHRAFAGTLWLSPETFRSVVSDVASSLLYHDIEGVVFVNGHGGNTAALREVAARLSRDRAAHLAAVTWFEAIDTDIPMGHAGGLETALLRHIAPELINTDELDAATANGAPRWGEWVHGVNIAYDTETFTENGVVGDPTGATAADGELLFRKAAAAVADVVRAVRKRSQA